MQYTVLLYSTGSLSKQKELMHLSLALSQNMMHSSVGVQMISLYKINWSVIESKKE